MSVRAATIAAAAAVAIAGLLALWTLANLLMVGAMLVHTAASGGAVIRASLPWLALDIAAATVSTAFFFLAWRRVYEQRLKDGWRMVGLSIGCLIAAYAVHAAFWLADPH